MSESDRFDEVWAPNAVYQQRNLEWNSSAVYKDSDIIRAVECNHLKSSCSCASLSGVHDINVQPEPKDSLDHPHINLKRKSKGLLQKLKRKSSKDVNTIKAVLCRTSHIANPFSSCTNANKSMDNVQSADEHLVLQWCLHRDPQQKSIGSGDDELNRPKCLAIETVCRTRCIPLPTSLLINAPVTQSFSTSPANTPSHSHKDRKVPLGVPKEDGSDIINNNDNNTDSNIGKKLSSRFRHRKKHTRPTTTLVATGAVGSDTSSNESLSNFQTIITGHNKKERKLFEEFLTMEYNQENLAFWDSVESYHSIFDNKDIAQCEREAQFIKDQFLTIGSPQEINLTSEIRKSAEVPVEALKIDTFDYAQSEIKKLLLWDVYPRYKRWIDANPGKLLDDKECSGTKKFYGVASLQRFNKNSLWKNYLRKNASQVDLEYISPVESS